MRARKDTKQGVIGRPAHQPDNGRALDLALRESIESSLALRSIKLEDRRRCLDIHPAFVHEMTKK